MIENQGVHVEVFSAVDDGLGCSWCRYLQDRIFVYLGDLLQFGGGVLMVWKTGKKKVQAFSVVEHWIPIKIPHPSTHCKDKGVYLVIA
jgi:hypothetical protein